MVYQCHPGAGNTAEKPSSGREGSLSFRSASRSSACSVIPFWDFRVAWVPAIRARSHSRRNEVLARFGDARKWLICAPVLLGKPDLDACTESALCTKCPVVALAGCSLSVTANVRTRGRRPLVLSCDIVTKPSASHRCVRTSEGVDLWPLRAMSIAVEASAADVPDNQPVSGGFVGRSCSRK